MLSSRRDHLPLRRVLSWVNNPPLIYTHIPLLVGAAPPVGCAFGRPEVSPLASARCGLLVWEWSQPLARPFATRVTADLAPCRVAGISPAGVSWPRGRPPASASQVILTYACSTSADQPNYNRFYYCYKSTHIYIGLFSLDCALGILKLFNPCWNHITKRYPVLLHHPSPTMSDQPRLASLDVRPNTQSYLDSLLTVIKELDH